MSREPSPSWSVDSSRAPVLPGPGQTDCTADTSSQTHFSLAQTVRRDGGQPVQGPGGLQAGEEGGGGGDLRTEDRIQVRGDGAGRDTARLCGIKGRPIIDPYPA